MAERWPSSGNNNNNTSNSSTAPTTADSPAATSRPAKGGVGRRGGWLRGGFPAPPDGGGGRPLAMSAQWVSMGSHLRGVLDVALRVPCIFLIDAILNSYYDADEPLPVVARQVSRRLLGE